MLFNRHTVKALTLTYINGARSYYRSSKQNNRASLYAKISPQGNPSINITPLLEKWVEDGNKVRFAELQRIIIDLRKRRRSSQALQILEWMKSKGTYTFTPVQHAVQLDLIGKVHGLTSAESYFNGLEEQDKTEKAYGALLHCYVRKCETKKALMQLEKMKESGLPLSCVAFNDIMCLYSSIGENEKVPDILKKMKEIGIQPDNTSYRICISSYGAKSDINGMEQILHDMENDTHIVMDWNTYAVMTNFYVKAGLEDKAKIALEKAEERLDSKDGVSHNHIISLRARLGNRDDVLRLWDLEKKSCKKCLNKDYMNMMESLLRLGELEEAEKVFKDWESSGNCYDFRVPSVVIVGYLQKGLCEKAEALLNKLMEAGKVMTSNIWGRLAQGYLEKGEMDKGFESLKVAVSLCDESKESKLDEKLITRILSLVDEKGMSDDDEEVLSSLKYLVPLKN